MKKINYYLGTLALAAMTLASCSSDEPMKGIDPGKVDVDQVRYLNVSISSPNAGSRADFQDADPTENEVNTLYFVFYDINGDVLYSHPVTDVNNDDFIHQTPDDGSVDKIWTNTVPVELSAGQNMPAYVMAFINPVTSSDLEKTSLSGLDNLTRPQVINGQGYFPMSNSVYYGTNPISGETDVRMVATPITTAQLYASPDEAKAADAKTVDIYVERYAARIDLTLSKAAISDNTTDVNDWTLTFVPEYWRPNAIDIETYVVKHYALKENLVPTIDQINKNFTWPWNAPTLFRSYWGCSPSYYVGEYPKVSDNITDEGASTYPLHYFSYKEISSSQLTNNTNNVSLIPSIEYNDGFTGSFYARESTASYTAWQNEEKKYNPAAVVTSAVIVGHYKITKGNDSHENEDFYLYLKTNNKYNLYLKDEILAAMMANQRVVLEKKDENYIPVKNIPTGTANPFIVEHPSQDVREKAEAVVAGRLVALQMATDDDGNPVTNTGYYYYDDVAKDYHLISTKDDVLKVNAQLLSAGYARKYGSGLAYFSIPIQHLGFEATSVDAKGVLDYTKCRAGSFGLVRNHLYTINVKSITGLATALRDENQPIVPPMDEQTYYISAKLNVLNWRLVPQQDVEL